MFNFCAVSAGRDMYTDTSKAANFRPSFQALLVSKHYGGNMLWKLTNLLSEKT